MNRRPSIADVLGLMLGGALALVAGGVWGEEPRSLAYLIGFVFSPGGPVGDLSYDISRRVEDSMRGLECVGNPACRRAEDALFPPRELSLVEPTGRSDWGFVPSSYPPVVQQGALVEALREGSRHRPVEAVAPELFSPHFPGDPWRVNLRSLADVYTGADSRSPVAQVFAAGGRHPSYRPLPGDAERSAMSKWVRAQLAEPEFGPPALLPEGAEEEITLLRLRGAVLAGLRVRSSLQTELSVDFLALLVFGPHFHRNQEHSRLDRWPDAYLGWVGEGWVDARPALPPEEEWCGGVATEILFLRALQLSLNDSADAAVRYLDEHQRRGCGPTPWSENLRGLGRVLRSKAATRLHLTRTSSPPPPRSM